MIAEYVMHVLYGIQTVQGGPTKWPLMLTGLLGIGFGVMFTTQAKPPETTLGDGAAEATDTGSGSPTLASKPSPPGSLRLRTV